MNRQELISQIQKKKSCLCVGLDPDMEKIPLHLHHIPNPLFEFCKAIIDATHSFCVAFKPNTAFFEAHGSQGWQQFEDTVKYIRKNYRKHFLIADAKRGDIGNTSRKYAHCFFEQLDCHALTVAPYMGKDSIKPFLEFENKWTIVLALTSNVGAIDFQFSKITNGDKLFEKVISSAKAWGTPENLMFVAGATRGNDLNSVRIAAGDHFLLVPGVGEQGGSLKEVFKQAALKKDIGIIINSSRGIIYAGNDENFAEAAYSAAEKVQKEMSQFF